VLADRDLLDQDTAIQVAGFLPALLWLLWLLVAGAWNDRKGARRG